MNEAKPHFEDLEYLMISMVLLKASKYFRVLQNKRHKNYVRKNRLIAG